MSSTPETAAPRSLPFRLAHLWLGAALLVTLLGFTPGYFLRLGEATWFQHMHGMSATLWMVLLVMQPWLATHGRLRQHRRNGLIGLIVGGMVIGTALAVLPFNIEGAVSGDSSPVAPPTFLYGVTLFDLVAISGFAISLIMAMLKVRQVEDHAMWMISTVFWVLLPGLARFIAFALLFTVGIGELTLVDIVTWTGWAVMALLLGIMIRLRKAHPALILALIGNASALLVRPLGDNEAWRAFCQAIFT
ncbi:hypothetical protein [Wenzhouxiangella marina]|uniref:Uncharacterized protein n=1 Tax=Wenzhouxiangella marina TaxID=1579979 RepID=A0A0K0XZ75_9GAMM|nr:hypothetical protein [Wenzhouxiangella marina]AKS42993.1 hypothetical protein WM2015_2635 [Wenzhouxiangella marina]MBB6087324.1 hypothetical protein [Wenzhouxiangella marina]